MPRSKGPTFKSYIDGEKGEACAVSYSTQKLVNFTLDLEGLSHIPDTFPFIQCIFNVQM